MWTGLVWLRIGTGGELFEFGIEPSGSMKCWESIEWPDRMDLGEVGWRDVDWIGLAKDRNKWRALVNSVLNLQVP
jgi:hypothetical protein